MDKWFIIGAMLIIIFSGLAIIGQERGIVGKMVYDTPSSLSPYRYPSSYFYRPYTQNRCSIGYACDSTKRYSLYRTPYCSTVPTLCTYGCDKGKCLPPPRCPVGSTTCKDGSLYRFSTSCSLNFVMKCNYGCSGAYSCATKQTSPPRAI